MWRLVSVLALCGMPALRADVCSGLPTGDPKALYAWFAEWTEFLPIETTPCLEDADAGAVLVAKLTSGELAGGDTWFGGQTKNPWNPAEGSSGSSAGPASATGAGCVGFAIGTETGGSIVGPSTRCGPFSTIAGSWNSR